MDAKNKKNIPHISDYYEFLHRYLCAYLFEDVFDWSKAVFKQQNPCSNHEIHVPFEHGFWATSLVNAT